MEESHSNCELFFYADFLANSKRTDYLSPSMNLCDQAMMGSRQCELTQPDASFLVCAIYDALKKFLQPSFVFLHLKQLLVLASTGKLESECKETKASRINRHLIVIQYNAFHRY